MVVDTNEFENSAGTALDAATNLQLKGDIQGAETAYKSLINAGSTQAPVYSNLATIHLERKELHAAIELYERAITLQPDFAQAHLGSGTAQADLGNAEDAIKAFTRAIKFDPQLVNAHYRLGVQLQDLSRYEEAFAAYFRVTQLFPDQYMAWFNLGLVREQQRQYANARDCFLKSIAIKPNWARAHFRLALNLEQIKALGAAEKSYADGLSIEPDNADAQLNLAKLLSDQGRFSEAIQNYQNAWSLNPDLGSALIMYWKHRQDFCDWESAAVMKNEIRQFIRNFDENSLKIPMSVFPLLAMFDDPVMHKTAANQYYRWNRGKLTMDSDGSAVQHRAVQKRDKIKLAYLSADFRSSVVYKLMAEVFEKHDRTMFEVHAFSYGTPSEDSLFNQRLYKSFDQFHDVHNYTDEQIARAISETGIDIAIDLMGYTGNAQPFILAHRPAPIQISYLGYLGTMAADFIDYLIADRYVLPEHEQENYSEKILYLPDCYQANCSHMEVSEIKPDREECGLPGKGFVFCCFNNSYKINPQVFELWMDLLNEVEGSVLWLYRKNRWIVDNLNAEAKKRGIDSSRIVFAKYLPLPQHLRRLENADLFLDTFPYGAGATCSYALWSGLPLITLPGKCFTSRMAASQLRTIGLEELIVANTEQYRSLAFELASSPGKLGEVKSRLKANRKTTSLFNSERFVKNLESIYSSIWQRHCEGVKPESFR